MILKIADYYSSDKGSCEYIESLYYCGRTYHDLGDYPTAMKYYQDVLDLTSDKGEKNFLIIRGNTLSVLTHILSVTHLYEDIIPYLMQLIEIDKKLGKDDYLVYDYIALGDAYFKLGKYIDAEKWMLNAKELAKGDYILSNLCDINIAGVKLYTNDSESALKLLRPIVENNDSSVSSIALTNIMNAYHEKGVYDSAAMYAKRLVARADLTNKKNGYAILL
ncbi:MAG: hypothetical protein K2H18_06960, partial [Muribaculaceae bacterium]|nr:hypothetical protein [Muribaculaceae bacterium]